MYCFYCRKRLEKRVRDSMGRLLCELHSVSPPVRQTAPPSELSIFDKINPVKENQITVLITRTGECYHVKSCTSIKVFSNRNGLKSVSFYNAKKYYRPCSLCVISEKGLSKKFTRATGFI